jgi:hypothetical protein
VWCRHDESARQTRACNQRWQVVVLCEPAQYHRALEKAVSKEKKKEFVEETQGYGDNLKKRVKKYWGIEFVETIF